MQSSRRSTSLILWSRSVILVSAILMVLSASSSRLMYSSIWACVNTQTFQFMCWIHSSFVCTGVEAVCEVRTRRPVVLRSPSCVSPAPPAAFPHTPAAVLLTAPASPEPGHHGQNPSGQFTSQHKSRLGTVE